MPIPNEAAINICLKNPINLLNEVASDMEKILFLKIEFINIDALLNSKII
tara:strand:- start:323 stop:472 length:150 start_codon:yes stop_codon:yes gene_type:complete